MGNITLDDINSAYALHEKWQRQYYADAQQVKDFKTALEIIKAHKIIEGEIAGKNETEREARARDLLAKEYDELDETRKVAGSERRWADEYYKEAVILRSKLAAAQDEIARLRGMIASFDEYTNTDPFRVCCYSLPGEEHKPNCPFYNWQKGGE